MLKKIILTIFRIWVGGLGFGIVFNLNDLFDYIGDNFIKSNDVIYQTTGIILLFIVFYILGLVSEKLIEILTTLNIRKIVEEE
jgi:uncharacterized protein YacL